MDQAHQLIQDKEIDLFFQKAISLTQQGNIQESIQIVSSLASIAPKNIKILNMLGELYWHQGHSEKAKDVFITSLQIDPACRTTLINLGDVYRSMGKLWEAREAYKHALTINPYDDELKERLLKVDSQITCETELHTFRQNFQDFLMMLTHGKKVNLIHFYCPDSGDLAGRIGELALGYDLFLRLKQIKRIADDEIFIFFSNTPANLQLQTMFKRELKIIESVPLLEHVRALSPVLYFRDIVARLSAEYDIYQQTKATLKFTREEDDAGQQLLREMGIGKDDWFVCIFARDPKYIALNYPDVDHTHSNFRDADINSYYLAIDEIAKAGGYILRIGSKPDKTLEYKHPRLIDYAEKYRSDFMDIYLQAHCRFCLGTPSGICEVTYLFDKPFLGVNVIPYGYAPYGKNCLFIPKKVRDVKTGQLVPFSKIVREFSNRHDPALFNGAEQLARGYHYEDNSPEEIWHVTKEMLKRLDGSFQQTAEDAELQSRYRQLIPQNHWNAHNMTPIGTDFLRRYASDIFGWS